MPSLEELYEAMFHKVASKYGEDIAQDAFVKLVGASESHLNGPYLWQTAHHLHADYWRKKSNRSTFPLTNAIDVCSDALDPQTYIEAQEFQETVERLIRSLTPKQRTALLERASSVTNKTIRSLMYKRFREDPGIKEYRGEYC